MPPPLALLLTIGFIVFLFRRDIREKSEVTGALWIPFLWMFIICSRPFSYWLKILGLQMAGPISIEEGSTLDACFYFALIAAGVYVLNKRKVRLAEVARNNRWVIAFLVYCFIAIFWSDFPLVAFKRWIKILGHPIMALILFTEPDPREALARLMKRSTYVLVPLSILFIKYYPQWGRGFSAWTGQASNNGVAENKNELGFVCLILGFFFFWHLLNVWRRERSKAQRNELLFSIGLLLMIWWLLWKASSATALLSLLIGMCVMVLLDLRTVNKRLIGVYVVVGVVTLTVAELTFGIFGHLVDLTGHDATMIGRSELWRELLAFRTNPIFGVGFESFWLGERLQTLAETHWWHPTEAHNGYLDIYLDLGLLGLAMLAGLFVATFRKIRLELLRNFQWGRFRLGFLAAIVFYNWTEASFKGLHPLWLVFYIICLDYPRLGDEPVIETSEIAELEPEMELAYSPDKFPIGSISIKAPAISGSA
jgi:exopolysaccharide production protein ExoQ